MEEVTGVEFGLSEEDQVDLALELILTQGGVALMSQIHQALKEKMKPLYRLSEQGYQSLQRIINDRAAEKGLVKKFNSDEVGWFITKAGVERIQSRGKCIGLTVKDTGLAVASFNKDMQGIERVLEFPKRIVNPDRETALNQEIVKRFAIIMLNAAWETIVKDVIKICVKKNISAVDTFEDYKKLFPVLITQIQHKKAKPSPYVFLEKSWKSDLFEYLSKQIDYTTTINEKKLNEMRRIYLGDHSEIEDLVESGNADDQDDISKISLRNLVRIRGRMVHRSLNHFNDKKTVIPKVTVYKYIKFLYKAAHAFESACTSKIS